MLFPEMNAATRPPCASRAAVRLDHVAGGDARRV